MWDLNGIHTSGLVVTVTVAVTVATKPEAANLWLLRCRL